MKAQTNYKEKLQEKRTNEKYLQYIIDLSKVWLHTKDEAKPCLRYLQNRISEKFHNTFNFGYFPSQNSSVFEFLDDLGHITNADPVKILETTKAASFKYKKGKGNNSFYYHHPLTIPFYDVYGKPVSIIGRTLYSDEECKIKKISKYKNLPFTRGLHLFGLNLSHIEILKQDKVVIVEGQFDFISMYAHGYKNAVGLCSASLGEEHIYLLKRYTNNFDILLDNDEAGEAGWKSIKRRASKYNINLRRIELSSAFHDVDDCLKYNPSSFPISLS